MYRQQSGEQRAKYDPTNRGETLRLEPGQHSVDSWLNARTRRREAVLTRVSAVTIQLGAE